VLPLFDYRACQEELCFTSRFGAPFITIWSIEVYQQFDNVCIGPLWFCMLDGITIFHFVRQVFKLFASEWLARKQLSASASFSRTAFHGASDTDQNDDSRGLKASPLALINTGSAVVVIAGVVPWSEQPPS
jgi:hypothetical protein